MVAMTWLQALSQLNWVGSSDAALRSRRHAATPASVAEGRYWAVPVEAAGNAVTPRKDGSGKPTHASHVVSMTPKPDVRAWCRSKRVPTLIAIASLPDAPRIRVER